MHVDKLGKLPTLLGIFPNRKEDMYIKPVLIMKWNIITYNIRGLNDLDSITKERCFIMALTPNVDIVMIQEHKLRGRSMDNLGNRLMLGCASWILEAAPGEKNWINPNATGKRGLKFYWHISMQG